MIIRPEQFNQLEESREEYFLGSMIEHLRKDFAADLERQKIVGDALEPIVRQAANDAADFGVETEDDLGLFIECLAILGPTFYLHDETAGEILNRLDVDGSTKMSDINEYLIFGLDHPR